MIQNIKQKARLNYTIKEKNKMSYKIIDFLLITLFILYMASSAPQISDSIFVVVAFIFSILVFIQRKRSLDKFLFVFILIWLIINFISYSTNFVDNVSVTAFLGVTIRMIMPYFIVKSIGSSFFSKFFDYAYILVVISLPLFILEQVFPPLFSAIAPIFSFMTYPEQVDAGGFYSFIFMHNGWAWQAFRNSGFMWEPGAFGGIVIFMLYYYWFKNGFKIDVKSIILVIAIVSTFSTAAYIALFFSMILFISKNAQLRRNPLVIIILLILVVVGSINFYYSSDFMSEKIDMYIEKGTSSGMWSYGGQEVLRVTRYGIFLISLENAFHNPLGNGVFYSDYILNNYGRVAGPSAISEILRQWGWFGWVMLVVSFGYWVRIFSNDKIGVIMFTLSIFTVLFSNPFLFKYLIYAIIFYAFIYKKHIIKV